MGLTEMLNNINNALRDPNDPKRAELLTKGGESLITLMNPVALGGRLLVEGAKALLSVGSWMLNKLGIKTADAPTSTESGVGMGEPSNITAVQNLTAERSRVDNLQRELNKAKADLKDAPKGDKNRREALTKKITDLTSTLEAAKISVSLIESLLADRKKADAEKEEKEKQKYPADFIGPLPPGAERKTSELTTPEVQTMLAAIDTAPGKFNEAFDTLPGKGGEGGTNFSSNAMTAINAGAPGAGATIGNAAVEAIKAGVSNLNINVNANVKTQEANADTGARTAVG
jgi:hypothetical protein